ncbi:MAG: NUDIX hydrolase [Paludibacter sp.]|nr:NUDIX hydrolase [Paludibacter sp.]
MDTFNELQEFITNGDKVYLPHFSIECVIFGYENKQLKVLLTKLLGIGWGIPSGYVKREEMLTAAATRILKERTSIDNIFLKQFHIFGDSFYRSMQYPIDPTNYLPANSWLRQRTLSIGFYALIDCAKAKIKQDYFVEDYKWVNINEIPDDLLMDHNEIVTTALGTLRNQIFHEPIGFELLPEKFTLPEIQALYETILEKKFDRRHFPNKLLSLEIIEKLDEKRSIGQHRSPFLYKFHKDNYQNALNDRITIAPN